MDGSIDQLNFEVILDDNQFKDRVERDIELANKLNTSVSELLNFKNSLGKMAETQTTITREATKTVTVHKDWLAAQERIQENLRKEAEAVRQTASASREKTETIVQGNDALEAFKEKYLKVKEETKQTTAAEKDHRLALLESKEALMGVESLTRTIAQLTGVAFGVVGLRRFVSSLVDATGQFEVQKMALTSMLQSAEKADTIFNTLRQKALESPYTFQDLTKYAKQLTAFNIDADSLIETEQRLADVAAGLGVDMQRIILAYGQVKAAGVLKGTELRQFTEAGVPLLQSLAEQIKETEGNAISLSEVFQRISKKQIPFEMVEEAFRRMTDEGGKFYKMQEVLVETLQGKISKLRDVWQQSLYDIGNSNSGILKGAVDMVTLLASHIEDIGRVLKPVIVGFGAYYATLLLVAGAQKALALVTFAQEFLAVSKACGTASAMVLTFGSAAKATAASLGILAAAAVVIVGIAKKLTETSKAAKELNKTMDDIHQSASNTSGYDKEISRVELLQKKLYNANLAYDERKRALEELKSIVPSYHGDLTTEGRLINDNKTALDNYISSLKAAAKAMSIQDELVQLETLKRQQEELVRQAKATRDALTGNSANYEKPIIDIWGLFGGRSEIQKANDAVKEAENGLKQINNRIDSLTNQVTLPETTNQEPTWTPLKENIKTVDDLLDEVFATLTENLDKEIIKEGEELFKENTDSFIKDLERREKAMKEWDAFIDRISNTQQGRQGTGVAGSIYNLMGERKKSDYDALLEYRKQLANLKAQFDENSVSFKNGKKTLDEWLETVREGNKMKYQESVAGLADELFKEQMQGFDLTNWDRKTLQQINEIKKALQNLTIPDDIKQMLDEETLGKLEEALAKIGKDWLWKTLTPEQQKKLGKMTKYAAQQVLELAKAFGELGDAIDNSRMQDAADSIQELGTFATDVASGYAQGGVFGAIAGAIVSIGKTILTGMTEDAKRAAELADAIKEAALSYEDAIYRASIESKSGIFGTDSIGKLQAYLAAIKKYGGVISGFQNEMSESFGTSFTRDYVDENGNLILEKLKADLNAGLFSGPVIDEVKNAIDKYQDALKEVDNLVESIFGDIAVNAADKIVDSWVEAGNAALDYADILDDVARSYSKMLIQSMIMETALDPITDDLKSAFTSGRYEDAMAMVANAMQAIQDATPMYEEILSAFDPYFTHGDSGSNSLGSGIKSITEDTANLLASYINAIRADVSVMRGLQESGWESISTAVPTMNDYLNRVAANTFDTAQNTQRILSELQSVIGAPGTSGMVVRVERM